jgi:NADH dehydrogenase
VVVVGGGFGGYAAAQGLKDVAVDVTVIDRHNHQAFQPLLYQVAAGQLSSGQTAAPIRGMLKEQRNATTLMATVTDIDVERREVVLERGERIGYDILIVACGGQTSYFGHDEWRAVSVPLKTLADAVELRNRIFGAFEEAERAPDQETVEQWLTFVVVGGGPTGVEISGQIAILARHYLRHAFRRINPTRTKVILCDAGDRVVPSFHKSTSAKAARGLARIGVTVRLGATVTAVDDSGATVKIGDDTVRIPTRTVVWAAGVRPVALADALARAAGATTDRAGALRVNPDLTLPGHPEISVIGDAASLAGRDGKPLPGLATVAIQEARHVAQGIRRGQPGATTPFRYFDKGQLAVVGQGRAVCEIRGIRLWGLPAFLLYLGVHLFYLGGVGGRRLTVLTTWISALFGSRQAQVITGELPSTERTPMVDRPAPS